VPGSDEVIALLAGDRPGPEEVAVRHALAAEVEGALAQLSVDQRTALVLVDIEGHSMEEAAVILGCAPGATWWRRDGNRTPSGNV
jgi:RNA polymerase sigma-70 factor (ECF subfamily)